ncbi:unnamed protein product [Merluccius merluccius]
MNRRRRVAHASYVEIDRSTNNGSSSSSSSYSPHHQQMKTRPSVVTQRHPLHALCYRVSPRPLMRPALSLIIEGFAARQPALNVAHNTLQGWRLHRAPSDASVFKHGDPATVPFHSALMEASS